MGNKPNPPKDENIDENNQPNEIGEINDGGGINDGGIIKVNENPKRDNDGDIISEADRYMRDMERRDKLKRRGYSGRTASYFRKKLSSVNPISLVGGGNIDEIKNYTLVEEIKEEGQDHRVISPVKIETLDSTVDDFEEDILIEDDNSRTPIMRRRSGLSSDDEGDGTNFYKKRKVVVQHPDDIDNVEESDKEQEKITEHVRNSLIEEENISGKLFIGQAVETYWNDSENKKLGFYTGIIQDFRVYNNDIQYEVHYDDGSGKIWGKYWEIIDNGMIFLDENMEDIKNQVIDIRKKRGTYSMVPIRRQVDRVDRRRISSLTNGRKKQKSQNPQTSKKRKLTSEENNVKRRKILSMN